MSVPEGRRRRARAVVFALLLLSFVGPWDVSWYSETGIHYTYFPELVARAFRRPLPWPVACVTALVVIPIDCLLTILRPQSMLRAIVYRAVAGATATLVCVLIASLHRVQLGEFVEAWGFGLYLATLLVALVVEVLPRRRAPKRDYAEVFR